MSRTSRFVVITLVAVVTFSCAGKQSFRVPPRIDLKQHEMVGVIEFDSSTKGELGPLVTRRFTEAARRDQGMVRIVALGSEADVAGMSPKALQALGREHGVQTILTGKLTISKVRPDIRIGAGLRSGSLSANVDATLSVQLIETSTGASIWSTSARATQSVGHISVFKGGDFVFDADDPERAYGGLVDTLVGQATRDFRATWERR